MSQAMTMSGTLESKKTSARPELDQAVAAVRAKADEFARLPVRARVALLREVIPRIVAEGPAWVAAGCQAKGIPQGTPLAGEEWLAGVSITVRTARLLAESLESIAERGKPSFGTKVRVRADGRIEADVFPASTFDQLLFGGIRSHILFRKGLSLSQLRDLQASFYSRKDPEGRVALVLGAGNVSSIPATDVLDKMFVQGQVCVLKVNPVNEWVGPFLERAFAPLVQRGYLRFAYGAGDVGAYLVGHTDIDEVHITGSDKTHDLIVWGPPGPDRDRRKAAHDPLLKKKITSELGNVSPVMIVPGQYSDEQLWFQARSVATMVTNNASFNCNAGKILVTSKGWPQRERFLDLLQKALGSAPLRKAYYPGAFERYADLTSGRQVIKVGTPSGDQLPWTLIPDVDSSRSDEKLFVTEPFCAIISATTLSSSDPAAFLAEATRFCNTRLWGTLNAAITLPRELEKDPAIARALDQAIVDLEYGNVAINHWPALCYGLVTPSWGGHPKATLEDVQSGIGFIHNTFMLEGIEKSVVRGPLVASPKPAWFYDNKKTHEIGEKLVRFNAAPSWWKVPGLAVSALGG